MPLQSKRLSSSTEPSKDVSKRSRGAIAQRLNCIPIPISILIFVAVALLKTLIMAPLKVFFAVSIFETYLISHFAEKYLPSRHFPLTIIYLFAFQILVWSTWSCIIYPKLFSPLRSIPGPSVRSGYTQKSTRGPLDSYHVGRQSLTGPSLDDVKGAEWPTLP